MLVNENGDKIDNTRNILEEISCKTKERIEKEKTILSLEKIKSIACAMNCSKEYVFEKALKQEGMSFICEIKKASPSKGVIVENFPYIDIALDYQKAGANAISCLTEPYYFQGDNEYLRSISSIVDTPVLRKDFTVDEYMIYEAKIEGADAILLICAILDDTQLQNYFNIADSLGLSVLVETHTKEEVLRAIKIGARIIGVNNRNLKNFHVDLNTSIELRKLVPDDIIFVSESGIKTKEDIERLKEAKVDAVLIGETLMREDNKKEILDYLRS